MPELPEVETVMSGMAQALSGKMISGVRVARRDLRVLVPDDFEAALEGGTFKHFLRRGKYIIIESDTHRCAVLHLGMSGRIKIFDRQSVYEPQKHDHIIITTEDGTRTVYNDPRRFGMFFTLPAGQRWQDIPPFDRMGAEPLDGWGGAQLYSALKTRKISLKSALLDQSVVAGLGNIYVCEALFMAGVSPLRLSCDITESQAQRLASCCIDVLQRAIVAGGSTLKDYRHTDGELGYFQHGFVVYGRENKECSAKGCNEKILRIVQAQRSTFYCPACQK